jgi:hypothetical protein
MGDAPLSIFVQFCVFGIRLSRAAFPHGSARTVIYRENDGKRILEQAPGGANGKKGIPGPIFSPSRFGGRSGLYWGRWKVERGECTLPPFLQTVNIKEANRTEEWSRSFLRRHSYCRLSWPHKSFHKGPASSPNF